jgi:hypothetical protein
MEGGALSISALTLSPSRAVGVTRLEEEAAVAGEGVAAVPEDPAAGVAAPLVWVDR